MPRTEYYDINAQRTYPLVEEAGMSGPDIGAELVLPPGFILDMALRVNPGFELDQTQRVRAYGLVVSGTTVSLLFWALVDSAPLLFSIDRDASDAFGTWSSETTPGGELVVEAMTGIIPPEAEALYSITGSGGLPLVVEPAKILCLSQWSVTSINLACAPRTRAVDETCGDTPQETAPVTVGAGLTGDVLIAAGHNCRLGFSESDSAVTLTAAYGAGAGAPCKEVLLPGEVETDLLSGGPSCADVLFSVGGVGVASEGQPLKLQGRTGITVSSVPEENKIVVTLDLLDKAVCLDE